MSNKSINKDALLSKIHILFNTFYYLSVLKFKYKYLFKLKPFKDHNDLSFITPENKIFALVHKDRKHFNHIDPILTHMLYKLNHE